MDRASLAGGLLDGDEGWLHTRTGCRLAALGDRDGDRRVTVPLCASEEATCDWSVSLDRAWGFAMTSCQRPDGSGWGAGEGVSHHVYPELVEHTADRAVWRRVITLRASPERHLRELHPCTPESLRALERRAKGAEDWLWERASVRGGVRTCDTSTGYAIQVVSRLNSGGIGVGEYHSTEPVDCRRPCAENPALERVRAANAWLAGRVFAASDAPGIAIYASEAACEASHEAPRLELSDETCHDAPK